MSAVFLPGLPMTVVADNAMANAPASRVLLDEPGLVARALGTLSLTFDLAGRSYDSIAAVGTSLSALDTIRIRIGSVADMSSGVVLDQTHKAWAGVPPTGKALSYIPLPALYSAQFVRVDLIAGAATLVEASRILIGKRIETDGVDRDAKKTAASGTQVDDGPGWTTVGEARTRTRWQATAGNIKTYSYLTEWAPFIDRVGKHEAFLFIPQTESLGLQQEAILCRNQDDPSAEYLTSERVSVAFNLFQV